MFIYAQVNASAHNDGLALEQNPQTARIPPLWSKVESGALESLLPKRLAKGKPFVVYYHHESPQGPFSVLLGYQQILTENRQFSE